MLNGVQATFVESSIMKIVIFKAKQYCRAMLNVDSLCRHGDISLLGYSILYYVFYVAHYDFNPVEISAPKMLAYNVVLL
jgi:hypothetical protein